MEVIKQVHKADYSIGTHEFLLSGSVGSAKSILLAHVAISHCLRHPRARFLVGRRALPDLRLTIWRKILEHLEGLDLDYSLNLSRLEIKFCNGSEIICRSWADGNYTRMRSLELSGAAIEELTEEDGDEGLEIYNEIKMRVGRLPYIKENIVISATNPGAPSHWAYKYFIQSTSPTRHVYYSVTTDNPYLPPQYIEQLKRDLDPKMALRMIYGHWIEIAGEVVYYSYDSPEQFIRKPYTINPAFPIILSWDFNIGDGKPMSMCCLQYIDDVFHVFHEVVIDGARTADTIDELLPILKPEFSYIICGDAAGKHRDTRGQRSDWDIIIKGLSNFKVDFKVPPSNPGVRNRHNRVNAYCKNADGQVRLFIYEKAPTVDEGLRLVKLKPGASYIEDDSKRYQHITTALGYAINMMTLNRKPQGTILL